MKKFYGLAHQAFVSSLWGGSLANWNKQGHRLTGHYLFTVAINLKLNPRLGCCYENQHINRLKSLRYSKYIAWNIG
jgi:hypothetical protein